MSFLEIALPLAERGFRVFPLVPENKRPVRMSWGDHFDAATTDRALLEQCGNAHGLKVTLGAPGPRIGTAEVEEAEEAEPEGYPVRLEQVL